MKKTPFYYMIAFFILVIMACGQETKVSPTAIPSRTPYFPSPTATPVVNSVCLQVNAGDFSDEIAQMSNSILADLGLKVLPDSAACDASLSFDLTIVPLSAFYINLNVGPGATCFTGAKVTGTCSYAILGYTPRTVQVENERPPESGVISNCPGPDDTRYMEEIWPDAVFGAFYTLWGDEFVFAAAEDGNPSIRAQTIGWLKTIRQEKKYSPQAERAMAAILKAVQSDPDPGVRAAAVYALGSIGVEDIRILPVLVGALSDMDEFVRTAAAYAIGNLGDEAAGAVPALIQTLQDPDWFVRNKAAEALGKIGSGAVEAVPALTGLLEDEEFIVRRTAITTLGEIGPGAMQAVPALIQSLSKEDGLVKDSTVKTLSQITGQDFGEDAAAWQHWWETQE